MTTGSLAIPSDPTPSWPEPNTGISKSQNYATATSTVIAVVAPMFALIYFCPLYLLYRHSKRHPRPINKVSGARLQQYGPGMKINKCSSALWLLLQYRFNDNQPSPMTRNGIRLLLVASCWTTVTAGTYTLFFLDPLWSKHPIASIGAQAIWVLITWTFWIAGAALLSESILTLTLGMLTIIWLAWGSTRDIRRPRWPERLQA
ncbi:hypothetical protein SERLADRAFT_369483 [Serpula lacrymans var. lacrymans S7.9]|uniref:Uncharacterized protein n=1 Tax=Serpula lacrymans var. lacrymans (strain S7.9) TaxID=578457 RepID=F8NVT8_SERL9|nr:uncharacterized protein SERLADRAFT_369483 [Serpula lacrymans var. lacrymans S7.9]EGO24249.1 hypothetical protein SERLADRAFT_369483 [Serpula lacrymans var. lacrymans S7.9]